MQLRAAREEELLKKSMSTRNYITILLLAGLLLGWPLAAFAANYDAAVGRVLVQLREPVSASASQPAPKVDDVRARLAEKWAAKGVRKLDRLSNLPVPRHALGNPLLGKMSRLLTVEFDENLVGQDQLIAALNDDPDVLYAEPDYVVRKSALLPDDTYFAEQWALNNTGQSGGTNDADIDAPEAWDALASSSPILVAVIDTGVDATHVELLGRVRNGYDFVNLDSLPADDEGHGTHVAGLIAAQMNNAVGIAGVAANAEILPVKALDQDGAGYISDIVLGLQYAADQGAQIINMSLGAPGYSQTLGDGVAYAQAAGCLVIAAMGNDGTALPGYPASFPDVIGVGASDDRDELTVFSNYGDYMDIVAPGQSILSTYPGQAYAYMSGTSMATPIVAGAAALAWGVNPQWPASTVADLLLNTADDQVGPAAHDTPGWDRYYGWGRLNLQRLIAAAQAETQGQVREGFESGGLSWLPWLLEGSPWEADFAAQHSGVFAAHPQAGMNPGDNADLLITLDCQSGTLGYWAYLASPAGDDRFELWIDGSLETQVPASGQWSYLTATVDAGSHVFRWRFVKGGAVGDGGEAWLDDITFPAASVAAEVLPPVVFSASLTNQLRPNWTWLSLDGATQYRYRLDQNDFTSGFTTTSATSYTPGGDLSDGPHILFVQEQGSGGAWSVAGFSAVLIDTQPPPAPLVSGPGLTGDPRPSWTWVSQGEGSGQFRYRTSPGISGWQETTATSYATTFPLREGRYTFEVQERDQAGNWSESGTADVEVALHTRLLSPNGGEAYNPGDPVLIQWLPVPGTNRYMLQYSLNGSRWKRIVRVEGGSEYLWTLPPQKTANDQVLLRVTAYQDSKTHSTDDSDGVLSFASSVVVSSLTGGELLTSGEEVSLDWLVRGYTDPVRGVIVKYTTRDMRGWKTIAKLAPNPDGTAPTSLVWQVPAVELVEPNCRIMVIVQGKPTVKAYSPSTFTIRPAP